MTESIFDKDILKQIDAELIAIDGRVDSLIQGFLDYPYSSVLAKEYARHGFSRRLFTIRRCVQRVFALIPAQANGMPAEDAVDDASIYIQAFVFNAFGALDNLAWIWVAEKGLTAKKGKPLSSKLIGLGPKNKELRQTLPKETARFLETLNDWFAHLEDFRHALAHRIPLYIIPYVIHPENDDAFQHLNNKKREARDDEDEYKRVKAEQIKLAHFLPIIKHSLNDNKPPIMFHTQLLNDINTVEQIGNAILHALQP